MKVTIRSEVHNEIWRINYENLVITYSEEKYIQTNNFAHCLYMFDMWSLTSREEYKYMCLEANYLGEVLNLGRTK
jgi:hypothetical protein